MLLSEHTDLTPQCGEGQSIVKVWGRGDHAKDVRGLVMELNAVAGRGEDPQVVLRRGLGGPGSQPRGRLDSSVGTMDQDDGRDFPSNASQLRFAEGAEELRSVGQASWARSGGFVPAGPASHDGGGGDAAAVGSWGSGAGGTGRLRFEDGHRSAAGLENARAGGVGLGPYREHDATPHHPSTWQQTSVQPTGSGGRGGSRWGVFASDGAAQGLVTRQGSGHQVCVPLGRVQHERSRTGLCLCDAVLVWRVYIFMMALFSSDMSTP